MRTPSVAYGMRLAIPIILGYVPVGFAYGILAVQVGMTPLTAGLMSLFVYAGAAQLIAVGMLLSGASVAAIIFTTFVVNLRHVLMSASLVPYLGRWTKPMQAWFCFEMTDESYALNLSRFLHGNVDAPVVFGANGVAHLGWVFGGVVGAYSGNILGSTERFGFDFALAAMFVALLLPHLTDFRKALAALCGALGAVAFTLLGAQQWSVLLATFVGASLVFLLPPSRKSLRSFSREKADE